MRAERERLLARTNRVERKRDTRRKIVIGGTVLAAVEHEGVHVAMLPLGEPRIELLEPTQPESVVGKFLEKRGEGLHHIALRVPDLNASVASESARSG